MTVYLDNCATTRPHDRVIEKMVETMRTGYHNPSALYAPAVDAMRAVRACREELLARVKGDGAIFTSGGTEANNLAILGASQRLRGDLIAAVSAVEHSSARQTYESLRARGADVRVIGVNETGEMDMESLERALADGARLVSVMHVNGETGAVSDIPAIHAHIAGRALLHVDGVQGFLRVPFDMKSCDLYSVS
ncbi:MAG: aminotransferase class V-fold PLP-dependent enzyme, partial [Christensenellales bacterium]